MCSAQQSNLRLSKGLDKNAGLAIFRPRFSLTVEAQIEVSKGYTQVRTSRCHCGTWFFCFVVFGAGIEPRHSSVLCTYSNTELHPSLMINLRVQTKGEAEERLVPSCTPVWQEVSSR